MKRFVAAAIAVTLALSVVPFRAADTIPAELPDAAFWKMISDFSEPGGYFHSDNYLSNEIEFQKIIPDLRQKVKQGGAYLGVGPEQKRVPDIDEPLGRVSVANPAKPRDEMPFPGTHCLDLEGRRAVFGR